MPTLRCIGIENTAKSRDSQPYLINASMVIWLCQYFLVNTVVANDDWIQSMVDMKELLHVREQSADATLDAQELCKFMRAWVMVSYHIMEREVFPKLEELKGALGDVDSQGINSLLHKTFGSVDSLEQLIEKLTTLMDAHYSLLLPSYSRMS